MNEESFYFFQMCYEEDVLLPLLFSIFLSVILVLILFILPYSYLFAVAIIFGALFRMLYLLIDIRKRINSITERPDRVKVVYENYLSEKS